MARAGARRSRQMKLWRIIPVDSSAQLASFRFLEPSDPGVATPPSPPRARSRVGVLSPAAMPSPAAIAAACADVLAGLDEDTLAYVSEGVADSLDDRDELVDFVSGMCGELCDGDDEAARAKAEALWERLHASSSTASPAPAPLARPPISLGASHSSSAKRLLLPLSPHSEHRRVPSLNPGTTTPPVPKEEGDPPPRGERERERDPPPNRP